MSRRRAIAAYFGMISFLDHNIGRLMTALEEAGLMDSTRVAYTSDHGDNLGCRGFWGKSNMYQDSVAVPMITAGPDIPARPVCRDPVIADPIHSRLSSHRHAPATPPA